MAHIAVILFPGSNCELEALRACKRVGMEATLVRWNETISDETTGSKPTDMSRFDGYILPGGFAYEDRGRSGIVASKDPILQRILQEANRGKPLLGICNGAQMLVELGAIPGITTEPLEMALAWNERIKNGKILGVGFYNDWIYLKNDVTPGRTAFNNFSKDIIIRAPVANGEGRYTTAIPELLDSMVAQEQTVFRYCDEFGTIINEFPINPNNALYNLAGICNPDGNIMALMPHPERSTIGDPIFASMRHYIEEKKYTPMKPRAVHATWHEQKAAPYTGTYDYTVRVKLIITDNEEQTIEQAFHRIGHNDVKLQKSTFIGINVEEIPAGIDAEKSLLKDLIRSNELMNPNKEFATITTKDGRTFTYDQTKGIIPTHASDTEPTHNFLILDHDNYAGKGIAQSLRARYPELKIKSVTKGTQWNVAAKASMNDIINLHLFHNPHAADIFELAQ